MKDVLQDTSRKQIYPMKRQSRTGQLLGHIIEPITEPSLGLSTANYAPHPPAEKQRYRLRELLKEESGKQTFLAT
ncbi:MAG: hypothetical protein AAFP20_22425, partial [Cyanobacteria bacterium J06614_10]